MRHDRLQFLTFSCSTQTVGRIGSRRALEETDSWRREKGDCLGATKSGAGNNVEVLIDASSVPLAVAVDAANAAEGPLLPAYSSDLNPIEQVFSWLKGKILKDDRNP